MNRIKLLIIFFSLCIIDEASAKEVLKEKISQELSMIKLGVFASKDNAKSLVGNLKNRYDTFTSLDNNSYNIYIVNIDPDEKYEIFEELRETTKDLFCT